MSEPAAAGTNRPIRTYRDFWPYYLQEHSRANTRAIHYAGTGLSSFCLVLWLMTGNLLFVPAALVFGYGPAWIGHFFIERNRPATFTYPLWSLISDYRMTWRWMTGQLDADLVRAGVPPRPRAGSR